MRYGGEVAEGDEGTEGEGRRHICRLGRGVK